MIKYGISAIGAICLMCGSALAGHGMHSGGMHSLHKMHRHSHMIHHRVVYHSPAVIWHHRPVHTVVRHIQPVRRVVTAPMRSHREVNRTRVIRRSCPAGG